MDNGSVKSQEIIKMKISVLISIYNKTTFPEFIKSFKSIINQTKKSDEIIIIFDGMIKFDIRFYLSNFKNVKIIQNSANMGLGISLSRGLIKCSGDIIIRQDSDTFNSKKRFFYLWKNISIYKYDIIGSYMTENSKNNFRSTRKVPLEQDQIYRKLNLKNSFNHPTVAFRKYSINKIGGYENVLFFEDYFLWLKARIGFLKMKNLNLKLVSTNINNAFFQRRFGLKYYKCFLNFLFKSYRKNYINFYYFLISLVIRTFIFKLNLNLLKLFYKFFLRKN